MNEHSLNSYHMPKLMSRYFSTIQIRIKSALFINPKDQIFLYDKNNWARLI